MDLTEYPLTPEDKAALQSVGNRLSRAVAPKATNLVHDATNKPAPDSRIDKAKKADLSDAYDQARQRFVAAEDHMRTVAGLIWTAFSPTVAFSYLAIWMLLAALGVTFAIRSSVRSV